MFGCFTFFFISILYKTVTLKISCYFTWAKCRLHFKMPRKVMTTMLLIRAFSGTSLSKVCPLHIKRISRTALVKPFEHVNSVLIDHLLFTDIHKDINILIYGQVICAKSYPILWPKLAFQTSKICWMKPSSFARSSNLHYLTTHFPNK